MNRSSDFQTGRLVLLASTVMCGGLAVAIVVPFFNQTELPSGKSTSQPTSSTSELLQDSQTLADFYPAAQSLTSLPPAHAANSSSKQSVTEERTVTSGQQPARPTAGRNTNSATTARTQYIVQNRGHVARNDMPFDALDSQNSRKTVPPGSLYAPVTVHPVTVNVDGGVMADRMATMTERFEKLLQSRDLVRQELGVTAAGRQIDNSAQVQQLAQLNQNLQDIVRSFEKFQIETQKTVNEISLEGRRAEIAYEEIRSVQRQLESQIARARLREAPQTAVLLAPMTRMATGPGWYPGVPGLESPGAGGVAPPAATPMAPLQTPPTEAPSTPVGPPLTLFNVPPTSEPAPFSVAAGGLTEQTAELPTLLRNPAPSPAAVFVQKNSAAATTKFLPQCSAPESLLRSPPVTSGVHFPGASVREQKTRGRFPKAHEIPPQTTITKMSDSPADQSELLLAYKARRLMQEAEEAMAAGDSAIALSRALQARSLASAGGPQYKDPQPPRAKTDRGEGMERFPAPAALATTSAPSRSPDVDQNHQQAMRLLEQARTAIALGELPRATDLAGQAEALNASYERSDDRPFLVREDIAWLSEARLASSVVARTDSQDKPSTSTSGLKRLDLVEAVQLAELPVKPNLVSAIDDTNPQERNLVKQVAYEHVYRFKLADVEPATETIKQPSLAGVPCRQCGKIHASGTVKRHKFVTQSKPVQQTQPMRQAQQAQPTQKRNLQAPKGARRSNRRMLEESDDSSETSAIWDAPAFPWASNNKAQNQPSTMHRLSSALRRLGRPATK